MGTGSEMGFRIRKSIKIGPLRVNLSKSGIGGSVGVKGFRVGVSSKGNGYWNAGTGIVQYRGSIKAPLGSSVRVIRDSRRAYVDPYPPTGDTFDMVLGNDLRGPFERKQIIAWHRAGLIHRDTFVRSDEFAPWIPYRKIIPMRTSTGLTVLFLVIAFDVLFYGSCLRHLARN